ncbi:MAG: preprotein translocase subunit SecA [Oscillospiraceae bacterium]
MGLLDKIFGTYSDRELKKIRPIADKVEALEPTFQAMSEKELRGQTAKFKERLAGGESLDDILPEAFAAVREAGVRVIGQRAFQTQVIGGIVLHQGRIAEMKTGEGKTLLATMPAYLNALTGGSVHVVTVNDYLAKYQSEWMGKLYKYMGLEVGLIVHGLTPEQRRAAYAADITYGTNNEMGFDYLRDNMAIYKQDKSQRGFAFAIVDEVDSILIDEARTPLIISGAGTKSSDLYEKADAFARTLTVNRVTEVDTKADTDATLDGDYIVDEKAKTATLTQDGIAKAERYFQVENLIDGDNVTLQHHINQAIKARGVMRRDVDYVVKDGQVIIVDESTGRLMMGRRYNEGLHQAIEAKEGVKVEKENKTMATITFQNYFRMYKKLSGMTGTALTEEDEFREIYKLDVIEIPTNRPILRLDHPDVVYQTEAAKYNAVIDEITEAHAKGQPVLVGTVSIEKSEKLSRMLKPRGIQHVVLNAKQHEREAEIVAQAGHLGAVTISTNMAGRGTDIMLGGNADFLAKAQMRGEGMSEELILEADAHGDTEDEAILNARRHYNDLIEKYKKEIAVEADKVREAGGLYIIGTERHESRRIDNQLRGRSGRQGDPGASRFFLSLEDDLMRLFGGERIQAMMDRINVEEDTPLESGMLSNVIESSQRKVEARNFGIRKQVLEYDDVMNRQREIIYGQRDQVLDGEDMSGVIQTMIDQVVDTSVDTFITANTDADDWNLEGLREHFRGWITGPDDLKYTTVQLQELTPEAVKEELRGKAHEIYKRREEEFTPNVMREMERVILLRNVDTKWVDHIDAMNELKQGIYLRSYAQRDPVIEYRIEGFEMFDEMVQSIRDDTVKMLYIFRIRREEDVKREQVNKPSEAIHGEASQKRTTTVIKGQKVGRNDPCPCGSGKKYKKCCGA